MLRRATFVGYTRMELGMNLQHIFKVKVRA